LSHNCCCSVSAMLSHCVLHLLFEGFEPRFDVTLTLDVCNQRNLLRTSRFLDNSCNSLITASFFVRFSELDLSDGVEKLLEIFLDGSRL
jgi:hypothetical protein